MHFPLILALLTLGAAHAGGPVVPQNFGAAETMPDPGALPPGRVLAAFYEGLPAHDRWLNEGESLPSEAARWTGNEFLLPRLPLRYEEWGIRESWKAPVLVRLAADLILEPGPHRFLVRARGLGRLWVNGSVIARTKPPTGSTDGHNPVIPVTPPPLPGLHPANDGQREEFGEALIGPDGQCRVIFETVVGSRNSRAESGELTVAVQTSDGKSYKVLGSSDPLTDDAVAAALTRIETALEIHDDETRRAAASGQDAYWEKRHAAARAWVRDHPAPPVPPGADHPVDAFLREKIERALAAAAQSPAELARHFYGSVLPVLQDQCFRCHGAKEKGGLRLDSLTAALKGGKSGRHAVVPGDAAGSELIVRLHTADADDRMPPGGAALRPEQSAILESWITAGAPWPAPPVTPDEVAPPPQLDDAAFLRRVFLDTVGVPPDETVLRAFLTDATPDKRNRMIDRLLRDERWADHWVSYWQDVLAENPAMLKPSLNNSGPFRWFLYESLRDGKPLDRLVTELILLRGSEREGGSAGFGMAADNDAPFAAKGHIVASAFLGIDLQCARCHDSPYHSTTQRDLYSLAALFERKPVTVPKSSTVPAAFFERKARESLIRVTLKPGESIPPAWPFAGITGCQDDAAVTALMLHPDDPRERLAALITAPQNVRFARVIVNRIWRRLMGAGFVEPAHDWEGHTPSHPELMDWLAREFVSSGCDVRHIVRLILTSRTWQRAAAGRNLNAEPALRFFVAPERRRLSAEQVVDSLFAAAGQPMNAEEISFDPDGRNPATTLISLGVPRRAWMFASLSNERDRPSLSLPRAQAVADVLEAFGWSGSRQSPLTDRGTDANVLQPGVLANSVVSTWLTRVSTGSPLANLAVGAGTPAALVDSVFLRFLSRLPAAEERAPFEQALSAGFADRLVSPAEMTRTEPRPRLTRITWSNHLMPEATTIQQEIEHRARAGLPPDPRLRPEWREVYEDFIWSLINTREFVWIP